MSTNAQAGHRLDFVDAHRGIAVLLMLWMHSADGWLRPELKQGAAWDLIRALGGLAAPTFLLLSGAGLALGWSAVRAGPTAQAALPPQRVEIARALQLVVLGYALRLQMWMLDGAGYRLAEGWAAAVPLTLGYAAAYMSLDRWARDRRAPGLLAAAAAGILVGFALLGVLLPHRLAPMLRVDVLQAIGASLLVLTLLRAPLQRAPMLGLALAAAIALVTPTLRSWMPGPLPAALAGYVAQWQVPAGQSTPTLFPLFPWLAYALAGACLGLRLGATRSRGGSMTRTALALTCAALVLAVLVYTVVLPARGLAQALPWSIFGIRVAYKAAAAVGLGGLAVLICAAPVPALAQSLVALGRASLVVYWVHLQLTFGTAARPIVRQLDLHRWAVGLAILTAAMIALALAWVHVRARVRKRVGTARHAHGVGSGAAPLARI